MQREKLQMIDTQSDRLYDVLNTLLDVWRLDAGTQDLHLAQVLLSELLRQLVERWQKRVVDHRFQLYVAPDVPAVVCDAPRIEQAMHHLLNNAVAYSATGSSITISVETNDIEVRIGITDEGVGIAPEHLDRIF